MPSHKTSHPQNRLDRCHRVRPRKPHDNSCPTQPCNSHLTRFRSQIYFYNSTLVFNLWLTNHIIGNIIEHQLLPSSGSYNNSHNLFSLRGIEEGHIPLSKHLECDIEVGGQLVHRVGILVKKDKIPLVDSKGRKAKTPSSSR